MPQIPPQWRSAATPPPPYYGRPRVDFEAIGLAWKVISADLWTWAGASLLASAVSLLALMPVLVVSYFTLFQALLSFKPTPGQAPNFEFFSKFFAIEALLYVAMILIQPIQFILLAGMMDMGLRRMEGQPIVATDVFAGFRKFGSLYVAGLLYTIAMFIGMALCYIPGFIALGLFSFVPLIVLRGQARGIEAMKMSWNILIGDIWMITILVFCAQLLGQIGGLLCFVGVFFTLPLAPITIALTYRNFFPPNLQPTEGPRA